MKAFWIVVNDANGPARIPYRHGSESSAVTEAERLASQYGGYFFVMQAKRVSTKKDVVTEELEFEPEPPF